MVGDGFGEDNEFSIFEHQIDTEQDKVDELKEKILSLGFSDQQNKKLELAFALIDKGATEDGVRNVRGDKVTLEIEHPVKVALKVKESASRHKDKLVGNGAEDPVFEAVLAGILHDYLEDAEGAKRFIGSVFAGDIGMQVRVEGWIMDVTKVELLERTVDDGHTVTGAKLGEVIGNAEGKPYVDDGLEKRIRKEKEDEASFENIIERARSGDFVPLIIKTADRIHNLETIGGLKPARQIEVMQQTREKLIPALLEFGFTTEAEEVKQICDEFDEKRKKAVATDK